jgi:hypothetical protein
MSVGIVEGDLASDFDLGDPDTKVDPVVYEL